MKVKCLNLFIHAIIAIYLGLSMKQSIASDGTYSNIEDRRAQLLEWADVKYKNTSDHRNRNPYWIIGDTAVNGCNESYSNYMVDFLNHTKPDKDIEMFILPGVVRYLYQFEHCLSKQNIEVLRNYLTKGSCCKYNRFFGHGTLNHAIIQASSWYLLAQYFGKETWYNHDGSTYTSEEITDYYYNKLANRFESHINQGHLEIASPNYAEVNFFAVINLVDFVSNSTLKSLASGEANKAIQYLRDNSFKGKLIPPLTREQSNEINGSISEANSQSNHLGTDKRLFWFYIAPTLNLTVEDFRSHRAPMHWILYILSDWLPDSVNTVPIVNNDITSHVLPGFSTWGEDPTIETEIVADKYIGENYAVGSSNIRYRPYNSSDNIVEFGIVVDSDNIFNQIDCTQPYWHSNDTSSLSSTDKLKWQDRSSPFMQTHLVDKNNILFISSIPEKDPFTEFENRFTQTRSSHVDSLSQFVRCRIPSAFDNIDKSEKVIQIKEGKTYIQIKSLSQDFTYESDDYYQYIILEGGKSAMHFYVTDEVSSMTELTDRASQYSADFTPENDQIIFTADDQARHVKMTFSNVLYKDSDSNLADREITYESIPLIEEVSQ